jgi:N-acetylmuramoyl-L-alanine amidase CwlA
MCVNEDADQQKVIDSTVRLVTDLMLKYKLTKDQVVRHYDITGKDCPKMFVPLVINGVKLEHAWLAFKDKLPITPEQPIVMSGSLEETKLTTWELLSLSLHQILAFIRRT